MLDMISPFQELRNPALGGSFEILRQSGWDLWMWVCLAASAVLLFHAILGQIWKHPRRWPAMLLIAVGVGGTAFIAATPAMHDPLLGMIWTFVLLCILSTTFYLNLRSQLGEGRTWTLLILRILALALLVPMLFEPVWRFVQRPRADRPLIFLIDVSGSMSVPDVQNGPSRIQSVWQTLAPELDQIHQHFAARYYVFATDCKELSKPEDLAATSADGKSTDISGAVSKAAADTPADKDPQIVLVSDGNDNVSPDLIDAVRSAGRKVNTLVVGSAQAEPANLINVAVDNVQIPEDVAIGHDVTVTTTIKSTALANRVVDVNMAEVGDDGKPLAGPDNQTITQRLVLQPVSEGQKVDLHWTPHAEGVRKLAIWIDPIPGERTLADNRQEVQTLAINPRIKVLYIEGALRPEYTYLNRMLGHDPNIELATLLRLQRERFAAAGTIAGRTLDTIPTTPDDWKNIDVILIGDLDSTYLSPQQQSQIRQRVAAGAGLLMIGGQSNFGAGSYQGSPIEETLPVFAGGTNIPQDKEQFVPELTPEGAAHPILDGLTDWFPEGDKPPAKQLSPLNGNVVVAGPKSGAQVLLVHPSRLGPNAQPEIVLAVQQYSQGRSAAFTADTTNIWYRQFRQFGQDSAYNRFWGQLIRWLAGRDVRQRQKGPGIDALLSKSTYAFGEPVKLRAVVRDAHGDATQYANVNLEVTSSQLPQPTHTTLAPGIRVGNYELVLPQPGEPGLKPGDYQAVLSADQDGKTLGKQTLKFTVVPPEDEMSKIAANPQAMAQIADETGGYHRPLAELPELIDTLIQTDPSASRAVERTIPLSNTIRALLALTGRDAPWPSHSDLPTQGALVIVLLAGEWILRRKWQMP
jgi:uncharacterized membrane protein